MNTINGRKIIFLKMHILNSWKKITLKCQELEKTKKINLFIDVTKISNVSGRENIGINVEYKKKNITALSAICDDNKIPLGITPMDTNLSKTKTGKHTIKHDVKGVQKNTRYNTF